MDFINKRIESINDNKEKYFIKSKLFEDKNYNVFQGCIMRINKIVRIYCINMTKIKKNYFTKELEMLKKIKNSNIFEIIDFFEKENILYIIEEFYNEETSIINQKLNKSNCKNYLLQLLKAFDCNIN